MKKSRRKLWVLIPAAAVIILLAVGFWYVNDYYHSDIIVQEYIQYISQSDESGEVEVTVLERKDGIYFDGPGEDEALIFYPGAKVEYTAYVPLLYQLAARGIDGFLVEMPCNLAFLGQNKADAIIDSYPYEHWYLSGHSLGGAMAASYAARNLERLDGLVLLAAYPTKDLKAEHFSVLSLYGSNDKILNMEKFSAGRERMPSDYAEVCIEGGNHAWFGNYGEQRGDGEAFISREEQQEQTVEAILAMISGEYLMQNAGGKKMEYRQITQQEAKELMDTEENRLILDVRTREEYAAGHIRGAVCVPNDEILDKEPEELPDKTQMILVYCRSGNRSKQAAKKLADMGYERILEFGGMIDWPYEIEE